jgi:hypothetical protein
MTNMACRCPMSIKSKPVSPLAAFRRDPLRRASLGGNRLALSLAGPESSDVG